MTFAAVLCAGLLTAGTFFYLSATNRARVADWEAEADALTNEIIRHTAECEELRYSTAQRRLFAATAIVLKDLAKGGVRHLQVGHLGASDYRLRTALKEAADKLADYEKEARAKATTPPAESPKN